MFISFSNGLVVSTSTHSGWPLEIQIPERCENMQQSCKVVDSDYNVVGSCQRVGDKYVYEAAK